MLENKIKLVSVLYVSIHLRKFYLKFIGYFSVLASASLLKSLLCFLFPFFSVHTWIAVSLLWCFQFVCVFSAFTLWGVAVTSLRGKCIIMLLSGGSTRYRDFLLETVALDDSNEI